MTTTTASPPVTGRRERVRLRLTVVAAGAPAGACDVVVDVPAGTALGAVRADLARCAGLPLDGPLACDGPVSDDRPVGVPPLLDGAVLVAGGPAARPPRPLLEVHVVSGPDAGRRVPLGPGTHLLGRGADAAVRVDDADVSRAHARLVVAPSGVTVTDLGSTNGTRFAPPGRRPGEPLEPGSAAGWADGTLLVVGASRFALRTPDDAPTATTADGAGHLLVNRAPRLPVAPERAVVRFPDPPPRPRAVRLPWPALVLPALLAVPTALWWHQPSFLLLALLTPFALLGQHLVDRRGAHKEARAAGSGHATATREAQERLDDAVAADARHRDRTHPDVAALAAAAAAPGARLWERSADDGDALVVRVGLGPRPAAVTVEGGPPAEHERTVVTLDLCDAGVVGLSGPGAHGLARALVTQVVTLLSPHDVRVVVRPSPGYEPSWGWVRWLPHTDGTEVGTDDWPAAPDDADGAPAVTLVVLDGAARQRRDPAVAALLARASRPPADPLARSRPRRVVVVCLDDDPSLLPAECRATVTTAASAAPPLPAAPAAPQPPDTAAGPAADLPCVLRTAGREDPCAPDGVSASTAARLARDLARLRDATPVRGAAALPDVVGLRDLLGLPPDVEAWSGRLADDWSARRAGPPRLRVPLGATADGPWLVDLRRDGPHALVAGTTGAGKSELLRSLVAALAVTHPPSQVSFLLVDYKGGTAFAGLDRLPHVAGLVTDLDRHTARRALTSLRAELRRREQVLRETGAADLDAYDRLRALQSDGPGDGPAALPRLVVVVDEFRVLAEELPDLLDGLLRVASVGRSLGVHLVLATQRPGGVVCADMRANLNLRVALRVRERADSDDVVEAPDAASLPASRPGRAVVRTGGGDLVPVQTALLDAGPQLDAGVVVRRWDDGAAAAPPTAARPSPQGDAAVRALVAACRQAWMSSGAPAVRPPWLPPLPAVLDLTGLPALPDLTDPTAPGTTAAAPGDHARPDRPPRFVLGLTDVPDEQRREPLVWDLADGNLAVVGGPGSGRTTALRAAVAAALRGSEEVHVHVLAGRPDWFGSGPPGLPRLGTVVPVPADPDRAGRLLRHLLHGGPASAWTLLVVDGWEAVTETLAGHDRGRGYDDLMALARDRGGDGLRLAAAGGRALLTGTAGAVLGNRLLLRTADPTDLLVAGLDPGDVPAAMPPGRAVLIGTAADGARRVVEVQVGVLGADLRTAGQEAALVAACTAVPTRPGGGTPVRLRPLPLRVDLAPLLAAGPDPDDDARRLGPEVVIGVGGDEAGPVALPLPPGEVVLVAGPPGSGRTTALAAVAAAAAAAGRRVLRLDGGTDGAPTATHGLGGAGPAGARPDVVIVDDVEQRPHDVLDRVEALVAGGATAVVAATAAEAAVAFRGPLVAARRSRCGLLLGTLGPGEPEVLGVREPLPRATAPGRGALVRRAAVTPVQVALPAGGRAGERDGLDGARVSPT